MMIRIAGVCMLSLPNVILPSLACQREEQTESAETVAAEAEARGDAKASGRASCRARDARKRADSAQ